MACGLLRSFMAETPRSDVRGMDAVCSSSCPSSAKSLKGFQPPRAPAWAPSPVSWVVPPPAFGKIARQSTDSSEVSTTVGEGCLGGSFTSSCDWSDKDDEPCMFSLEEDTCEDDHQDFGASLHDMCMVGFEDGVEAFKEDVAPNDPPKAPLLKSSPEPLEVPCFALDFEDGIEASTEDDASNTPSSNDVPSGASSLLLSALAQVQAQDFPPQALLQPPKAPLLKSSPDPFEVPCFALGFEDGVEVFEEDVASNPPSSKDVPLGASPSLLSALAQVQARKLPRKALLQPPRAPLLKASPDPLEVPYFELPMSSASPECDCH